MDDVGEMPEIYTPLQFKERDDVGEVPELYTPLQFKEMMWKRYQSYTQHCSLKRESHLGIKEGVQKTWQPSGT